MVFISKYLIFVLMRCPQTLPKKSKSYLSLRTSVIDDAIQISAFGNLVGIDPGLNHNKTFNYLWDFL